jgi:hypothetical protein
VRDVVVSGLHTSRRRLVDPQLTLHAGDPLSWNQMGRLQRNLYNLGVFDKVDMAIQNSTHRVRNGFIEVIPFHQHGIKSGDTARIGSSTSFQQSWQQGKNAGGIATRGGGFTCSETDFPLSEGKSGHAIHYQQDITARIAKVFGNGGSQVGRSDSQYRRIITRGDDDHTFGQTAGTQITFDKLAHLTPTLANQNDHIDIRFRAAGNLTQQGTFADAASGKNSQPLSSAARQKTIDRSYTGCE